jgi:hypothetical protein
VSGQVIAGVIALLLVFAAAGAMTLLGNQLDPHNRYDPDGDDEAHHEPRLIRRRRSEADDEAAEEDRRRLR